MPARPGESEEEYRKRREAEKSSRPKETEAERAARKAKEAAAAGGEKEKRRETEEERAARKAREAAEGGKRKETDEERAARKAREAAEGGKRKETEEERAARKAKEAAAAAGGDKEKRRETEEERAARKAREAAEGGKRKETEEERAARKAKEREREKEKERERREREDKKVVRVEANIGSVHRSSTKDPDAERTTKSEPKVQGRPAPNTQNDDDDDDGYGEDDFVDAAEAEALEKQRKAMEAENERIRKAMAARSGGGSGGDEKDKDKDKKSSSSSKSASSKIAEDPTVQGTSQISVEDLKRQKYRAQFEADLARATALRRLVDLDSVSVTIADIAPMSEYDLYIRSFGGSERVQTAVQAPPEEDIADEEIQAERVVMKAKASQVPEDLGLFPERQMIKGFGFGNKGDDDAAAAAPAATAAAKKTKKDKDKDKDGAKEKTKEKGSSKSSNADAVDALEPMSPAAVSTSTSTSTAANAKNSVANSFLSFDTASLSSFLTRVFPVVRTLMDEMDASRGVGMSSMKAKSEHPFSSSVTDLTTPLVKGRPVVDAQFSKSAPQNLVALYGPSSSSGATTSSAQFQPSDALLSKYPSIVLMWNVNDPTGVDKVLVSTIPLTAVCCSPTRPHLVYAGTASGSVCVWDLREPSYRHTPLPDSDGSCTVRLPSFSTEWLPDNHDYPIVQVVVAGYNSSLANKSKDEVETLTTIDSRGSCFFWMLNEDVGAAAGGRGAKAFSSPSSPTSASPTGSNTTTSPTGGKRGGGLLGKAGGFSADEHGQSLFATVKLFKASAMNLLPPNARADAVSCCEYFPSDPTQMVAGASNVVHFNRYGSITAPSHYAHYARWSQTSSTSPVTSLHFSPLDSRVLLASYQDGSVRLFLKDSSEPKLTIPLAHNGAISRIRCSPALRWITFALDTTGTFYALDHASNHNKTGPTQKALISSMNNGKCVTFDVSAEERVESRVAFGFEYGLVQVHSLNAEALKSEASDRNDRWL